MCTVLVLLRRQSNCHQFLIHLFFCLCSSATLSLLGKNGGNHVKSTTATSASHGAQPVAVPSTIPISPGITLEVQIREPAFSPPTHLNIVGEVADYSPDYAKAAFQALMKRFDSLNTEENPSRLPLLGKGLGDDNSTYYKEHNQTTGSDDYKPSESLLPSDSSHAYTDYDELGNVATGPDDSNRSESLLPSVSSHANMNYGEQGNVANVVGSDDSNLSVSLLPSISPHAITEFGEPGNQTTVGPYSVVDAGGENNDFDHPRHGTRVTILQWIFMLNGLSLEMLSAYFDQLSSPNKSDYALVSLLLAIAAVLTCILELIHNGIKDGVESTNGMVFGTLPDIFGLGLSLIQCLCSAVQYHFLRQHENNPMKLSPVPLFFFCCLVVLKLKMN